MAKDEMEKSAGTALTPYSGHAQGFAEEMDGLNFSFDRVKIPSGGGLAFKIPNPDNPEKPKVEAEIIGIIVDHHPVNAYWKASYTGESNAPDCASMDARAGQGVPGGPCKTCPMNQYDDSTGKKLCKNMHRVYLQREGEGLPLLLTLPPTSLRPFADWLAKAVVSRGLRSTHVKVRIGLSTDKSKGGIEFSKATFSTESVIPVEERPAVEAYSASIKDYTRRVTVEAGEADDTSVI